MGKAKNKKTSPAPTTSVNPEPEEIGMPTRGKKQTVNTGENARGQKTIQDHAEPEEAAEGATDMEDHIAVELDEDGDPDFSPSFSNESLTWLRKVIRVQAADVIKCEKKSGDTIGKAAFQEFQKKIYEDIAHMKVEMDSLTNK